MKVWRVLWIGKEINSVEMIAPDLQRAAQKAAIRGGLSATEQASMMAVGVEMLRTALLNCIDMPDKQQGHGCFVEADDVPGAYTAAKSRHPDWRPS